MRCEELVPIFHSVKFAKCEICGSRMLKLILPSFSILPSYLTHMDIFRQCFLSNYLI